jgi:hypothetical protein
MSVRAVEGAVAACASLSATARALASALRFLVAARFFSRLESIGLGDELEVEDFGEGCAPRFRPPLREGVRSAS